MLSFLKANLTPKFKAKKINTARNVKLLKTSQRKKGFDLMQSI